MESKSMSGIETTGLIGGAAIKAAGAKAALGMAGAAVLYLLMPPERPDGTFNRKEFAAQAAPSGLFSFPIGPPLAGLFRF